MRRRGSKAASLVTTLLGIVVLSTLVVAFMQSTSIDRLTAKSAKNVLQAETFRPRGIAVGDKSTPDRGRNQQWLCHRQHQLLTE